MIHFRDKAGRVYLQVYDPEKKRGRVLPRHESRHLDELSDEEIRAILKPVQPTPKLTAVEQHGRDWLTYLDEQAGLDPQTVKQRKSGLARFVFPFFVHEMKLPVEDWPNHTAKFYKWLASRDSTAAQIRVANTALRKFYKWLGEENIVKPVELALRTGKRETKDTPLIRPVSPEEVLKWARECPIPHLKFIGLAGYFFSLRPQEVFALRPEDFNHTAAISALECVKVMKSGSLGTKLVVYIAKQKQNAGTVSPDAKKGSKGWVCCFHDEAAAALTDMLRHMRTGETICKWNNKKLYDDWRHHGLKGISVKDLRRASAYFLGHHSGLSVLHLMKHMRHKKIETTMIYCRRPDEALLPVILDEGHMVEAEAGSALNEYVEQLNAFLDRAD
jgi:integrase